MLAKACKFQRTSARGATDHQAKLDTLLDILLSADLDLESEHVSHRHYIFRYKGINISVELPGHSVVRNGYGANATSASDRDREDNTT